MGKLLVLFVLQTTSCTMEPVQDAQHKGLKDVEWTITKA